VIVLSELERPGLISVGAVCCLLVSFGCLWLGRHREGLAWFTAAAYAGYAARLAYLVQAVGPPEENTP